ncbi:hypothetical protein QR680_018353 [Steinernema hermaphroditum]|uniref:Uncharacterized protein n=1 Tax=Steinernema hermaphroditum TaxID=289476 RepID=A0AA39HHP3_9BILA|nr:hypothetical protein QR680_018353 [Steinernema hermaphroditum]
MATQSNGTDDRNRHIEGDLEAAAEDECENQRSEANGELQAVVVEPPRPQQQEPQNPLLRILENDHPMIREDQPSMFTCGLVTSVNLLKSFVLIYWFTTLLSFVLEGNDSKVVLLIIPFFVIFVTMIGICNENWVLLFPFLFVSAVGGAFHVFRLVTVLTRLPLTGLDKTHTAFEHIGVSKDSEPGHVIALISGCKVLYFFAVVITILEVQLQFWNNLRLRGLRAQRVAIQQELLNQQVANVIHVIAPQTPEYQPARPVDHPPSYTTVVGNGYRISARRTSQSTTDSLVETAPPSYSHIFVRRELKSDTSAE